MIPYSQALQEVLSNAPPMPRVTVDLDASLGYFLAQPARAKLDMPRFDQSAMDGYAVRAADLEGATGKSPVELDLIGELPAGSSRRLRVRSGKTVKIFTGSRLPPGADAVVMKEYCDERGDRVRMMRKPKPQEHIRFKAEEFRRGDPLLPAGTRITPPVIGLLANFGHAEVQVRQKPAVTLLTIGDELVLPGGTLGPGKIYNSNQPMLVAALRELGIDKIRRRLVRDDLAALQRELHRALRTSNVVITAGGASVGDHDHVGDAAAAVGIREIFRSIAIKPGKPTFFGLFSVRDAQGKVTRDLPSRRLFFGLPGNPVSALVACHQLVKPALLRMMGQPDFQDLSLRALLATDCRKDSGRLELLRGRLAMRNDTLWVHPSRRQGSHMLGGMAEADCLIHFPRDRDFLGKGETVTVQLLSWNS